jgi:hypothetical protein
MFTMFLYVCLSLAEISIKSYNILLTDHNLVWLTLKLHSTGLHFIKSNYCMLSIIDIIMNYKDLDYKRGNQSKIMF